MGLATGHPLDLVAVGIVTVPSPVVVDVRPVFPMATTAAIAGLSANGQQLRRWRLTMPVLEGRIRRERPTPRRTGVRSARPDGWRAAARAGQSGEMWCRLCGSGGRRRRLVSLGPDSLRGVGLRNVSCRTVSFSSTTCHERRRQPHIHGMCRGAEGTQLASVRRWREVSRFHGGPLRDPVPQTD